MSSLLVVADGHYYRDIDGNVYSESVFNYEFYRRYLAVFDKVYALGRMTAVEVPPKGKMRADGPGVEFLDLLPGRGFFDYVRTFFVNRMLISRYSKIVDCAIVRVPGVVANLSYNILVKTNIPVAIEVVVDPWVYFANGVNGGKIAPFVRLIWSLKLKHQCKNCIGVAYVTEQYLQERYPSAAALGVEGAFSESYSSVDLPDNEFGVAKHALMPDSIRISHAANSFSGNAKGHYTLFNVVKILKNRGYRVQLTCIGDGLSLCDYRKYVKDTGIEENVIFTGRLADGMSVRKVIAESDIFVFPTRAEGLPRVLLEAMAEGLPCLSSPVCGVPELLDSCFLFDPDDAFGFADAIVDLVYSPEKYAAASVDNIRTAKRYTRSILQARRVSFYKKLRDLSEGMGNAR